MKVRDIEALDKKTHTVSEIASKHGVDEKIIVVQLQRGIEVEKEHTSSDLAAEEIALDHLWELPDYSRLAKMEKE